MLQNETLLTAYFRHANVTMVFAVSQSGRTSIYFLVILQSTLSSFMRVYTRKWICISLFSRMNSDGRFQQSYADSEKISNFATAKICCVLPVMWFLCLWVQLNHTCFVFIALLMNVLIFVRIFYSSLFHQATVRMWK